MNLRNCASSKRFDIFCNVAPKLCVRWVIVLPLCWLMNLWNIRFLAPLYPMHPPIPLALYQRWFYILIKESQILFAMETTRSQGRNRKFYTRSDNLLWGVIFCSWMELEIEAVFVYLLTTFVISVGIFLTSKGKKTNSLVFQLGQICKHWNFLCSHPFLLWYPPQGCRKNIKLLLEHSQPLQTEMCWIPPIQIEKNNLKSMKSKN